MRLKLRAVDQTSADSFMQRGSWRANKSSLLLCGSYYIKRDCLHLFEMWHFIFWALFFKGWCPRRPDVKAFLMSTFTADVTAVTLRGVILTRPASSEGAAENTRPKTLDPRGLHIRNERIRSNLSIVEAKHNPFATTYRTSADFALRQSTISGALQSKIPALRYCQRLMLKFIVWINSELHCKCEIYI